MNKYDKEMVDEVKRTGIYRGQKLTGRLEMRLSLEVEMALIDLVKDNTKTKSEVVIALLLNKRLYYHLNEKEQEIYSALLELRLGFIRIKSYLHGMSDKERLKFFDDNPDYVRNWRGVIDQCIDQWSHLIERLSE